MAVSAQNFFDITHTGALQNELVCNAPVSLTFITTFGDEPLFLLAALIKVTHFQFL